MKGDGEKGRREEWKIGKMEEWKKKSKAMMKLLYYVRRFLHLPSQERLLFIYGIYLVIISTLIVKTCPIKTYLSFIRKNNFNRIINSNNLNRKIAKKTFARINSIIFWKRSCLINSIVYHHLLLKVGINSHITLCLTKTDNLLVAHAFVLNYRIDRDIENKYFVL
jgi:hypothetical protein